MTSRFRFEYVKQQVDALTYIQQHVQLHRVGIIYKGLCPFHDEHTPSFTVYPIGYQENPYVSFYCFGCSAGGDILEFRRRLQHLTNPTAALELFEQELGIEPDDTVLQLTLLRDELRRQQHSDDVSLSLSDLNVICSRICRHYLAWVEANLPTRYEQELGVMHGYYRSLDDQLLNLSALEAQGLIDTTHEFLALRRATLEGLINNGEN